ncbi:MAG TPA: M14 family metallopeptidase [Burkholderiales bacterium]|nr:M14 family metallopeptidase [Burkholderiales bacterium]
MTDHYPVELSPPDIAPYRQGNAGVDYVHLLDSGKPGPNVMIQALTHGNEICGALAVDWLFRQQVGPARGKLTLAFANVEAFARFDYDDPDRSRYIDEDYNRVWADDALFGSRDSIELRRARQLQPFVDAADFLLDLHSMHEPCRPIMVCGTSEKSAAFSRQLGVPGDLLIDTGHPAGLRMMERGGFGDPASPRTAVLIECGQHWEMSSEAVAKDTVLRFLKVTGAVAPGWADARITLAPPKAQRLVRVTQAVVAKSMAFKFAWSFTGLEVIPKAGTVIATDGDTAWMTPYDNCVMVMPSVKHLKPGTTLVRLGRYD